MDKLLVISPVNPLRAYSGVKYLCDALTFYGVDLELWANIPRNMLHETSSWRFPVRSFFNTWYGYIPRFRILASKFHVLQLCLNRDTAILYMDYRQLRQIALIKKLKPQNKYIHYCTEFFSAEEFPKAASLLSVYKKHCNIADIIIDVEPNRAKLRKEWYSLTKDPLVIPNTIPKTELPEKRSPGGLSKLADTAFPKNVPILLYTGGCYFHREFNVIIDALRQLAGRVFFLAFVYGNQSAIVHLRNKCSKILGDYQRVCDAVPRRDLLACIHEADAGIVCYPPSVTIGNLYAAPTKFYEYIACGLPVVCAPNPGLVGLIEKYHLGVYAKDETSMSLKSAIEDLLFHRKKFAAETRKNLHDVFSEHLCYEVASQEAISKIVKCLKYSGGKPCGFCRDAKIK